MSTNTLNTRIQLKHDISLNWNKDANFIPLAGELIYYDDLKKIKVGDGSTSLGGLDFIQSDLSSLDLTTLEKNTNKVTTISSNGANEEYPSAKAVYDLMSKYYKIIINKIIPQKGNLIKMPLGNAIPDAGTQDLYRILSINEDGTDAFVMAMYDQVAPYIFGPDGNIYSNLVLDSYLEVGFFPCLDNTVQSAIIAQNIIQYQYTQNSSGYNANTYASYYDYGTKTTKGNEINRHVYALDFEDIINYLGTSFSTTDIWTMFWNTTSAPSTITYPWLRSASADSSAYALSVNGNYGYIQGRYVSGSGAGAVRPAFHIDLSKVSYTINS